VRASFLLVRSTLIYRISATEKITAFQEAPKYQAGYLVALPFLMAKDKIKGKMKAKISF
jgi:hypothetical protein